MSLDVTYYTDPACPWAYSANPALSVLRWRYGEQLRWRLVVIGLTESREQYEERGYTGLMMAVGYRAFGRRYGMPVAGGVRERPTATARGCRAIVAARLQAPEREWAVLRALQFAWFTTDRTMDDDDQIAEVLEEVDGVDAGAITSALGSPEVAGGLRARPSRGAVRRRVAHRVPGQGCGHGRSGALHGSVADPGQR